MHTDLGRKMVNKTWHRLGSTEFELLYPEFAVWVLERCLQYRFGNTSLTHQQTYIHTHPSLYNTISQKLRGRWSSLTLTLRRVAIFNWESMVIAYKNKWCLLKFPRLKGKHVSCSSRLLSIYQLCKLLIKLLSTLCCESTFQRMTASEIAENLNWSPTQTDHTNPVSSVS